MPIMLLRRHIQEFARSLLTEVAQIALLLFSPNLLLSLGFIIIGRASNIISAYCTTSFLLKGIFLAALSGASLLPSSFSFYNITAPLFFASFLCSVISFRSSRFSFTFFASLLALAKITGNFFLYNPPKMTDFQETMKDMVIFHTTTIVASLSNSPWYKVGVRTTSTLMIGALKAYTQLGPIKLYDVLSTVFQSSLASFVKAVVKNPLKQPVEARLVRSGLSESQAIDMRNFIAGFTSYIPKIHWSLLYKQPHVGCNEGVTLVQIILASLKAMKDGRFPYISDAEFGALSAFVELLSQASDTIVMSRLSDFCKKLLPEPLPESLPEWILVKPFLTEAQWEHAKINQNDLELFKHAHGIGLAITAPFSNPLLKIRDGGLACLDNLDLGPQISTSLILTEAAGCVESQEQPCRGIDITA